MKNIIFDIAPEAELAAALSSPRPPLLPPLGSKHWNRVALNPIVQRLLGPVRSRAEAEIDEPMPELTDALYADLHLTGRRMPFETRYLERRHRLGRAQLCALLAEPEDVQRWLPSVESKIGQICDEPSWAAPACIPEIASGKDPMLIDLACALTASFLGESITLFGEALPADLIARAKDRITTYVLDNYLANHQDIHWTSITNNWNAVCHQGILGAALAFAPAETCARIASLAASYFPNYLGGYGSDGGCEEGPHYWNYGFGWFSVLNDQLETASRGALSLFEGSDPIRRIAAFGPAMLLTSGKLVNFSDCSPDAYLSPHVLGYLAKRFEDPLFSKAANAAVAGLLRSGIRIDDQWSDPFYLVRLFASLPTEVETCDVPAARLWLDSVQMAVCRSTDSNGRRWDFAAKGGHNGEHHNHNDCGSYLLNIDGEQMIVEVGMPEYDHDYFSAPRYENLAARTMGHSLPIVNGQEQAAGREHTAVVIDHVVTAPSVRVAFDLSRCYPGDSEVVRLVRRFHLEPLAGKLSVTDDYACSAARDFETAIMVFGDVELIGSRAIVTAGAVRVAIDVDVHSRIATVDEHHFRTPRGEPRVVRRIVLKPRLQSQVGCIAYTVECD